MANWVVRNSDSAWMVRGFGDPSLINTQPANYTLVDVPGDACPDPRMERYDATSPTKRRAATTAEQTAYDDATKDAKAANIDLDAALQAVAQLDFEERQKLQVKAGQSLRTAAECRARLRVIYRSLL